MVVELEAETLHISPRRREAAPRLMVQGKVRQQEVLTHTLNLILLSPPLVCVKTQTGAACSAGTI